MANLTGQQVGKIRDAVVGSFELATFDDFLDVRLDRKVENIAGHVAFPLAVRTVVNRASQEGWHLELLKALRESRPHLADVFTIAVDKGIDTLPLDTANLEREVRKNRPDVDFEAMMRRVGGFRSKICHISYNVPGGTVHGTGFLLGPSTVITNRHVVSRVIDDDVQPSAVRLTFDYYRADIGLAPNTGTVARLSDDGWLIDDSAHDALDTNADADPNAARPDDALDFAVLKLDQPIGEQPVGSGEDTAEKRGWIHAAADAGIPAVGDVVFIFQHPDGKPLKWAQPDVVLGINENHNRIRYAVNTEGGSSGSPVFDSAFQLVALHHAGDPNFEPLHRAEYNQGIPIAAIVARLVANQHNNCLGDDSEGA